LSNAIERFGFIDPEDAVEDIEDLINNCIGDISTDKGKIWREFSPGRPDYKQNANSFLEASKAQNPLSSLASHRLLRTKLRSRLRTVWAGQTFRKNGFPPELADNNWEDLPDRVQISIKSELELLASREQAKVRRGRPQKNNLDALVQGLADIFASQTGYSWHIDSLPHALESRFIQFAFYVLDGHVGASECSELALARRWKRIKAHSKTGLA